MSQSRLTLNLNVQYVKDWGATLRFLRALDPVAVVAVIDTLSAKPRVLELKAALPNAKIIVRCVIVVEDNGQKKELDGSLHTKPQDDRYWLVSPGDFLNTYGELGQGGLSLSYFNEPQTSNASDENIRRQVQHMIETLGLAIQRGISLVVGNWGVGQSPDWAGARFDDVLTLISRHSELFTAGLHLYAPVDTFKALDGLIARCKAISIAKVPVIISEFGFDTDGNANGLNGYKSRGYSGVQFGGWCVDKVKNMYSPYIQAGTLDSVAVFGWGYAASFPNFDVETDTDWQAAILDAASKGVLSVTTTPVTPIPSTFPAYTPPAFEAGSQYTMVIAGAYRNLRDKPGLGTGVLSGQVNNGATVTAFEQKVVGLDYWWRINVDRLEGWVSLDGGAVEFRKVAPPVIIDVPPVTTPPNTPPPPAEAPKSAYAMLHEAHLKVAQAHLALAQLYRELDSEATGRAA